MQYLECSGRIWFTWLSRQGSCMSAGSSEFWGGDRKCMHKRKLGMPEGKLLVARLEGQTGWSSNPKGMRAEMWFSWVHLQQWRLREHKERYNLPQIGLGRRHSRHEFWWVYSNVKNRNMYPRHFVVIFFRMWGLTACVVIFSCFIFLWYDFTRSP